MIDFYSIYFNPKSVSHPQDFFFSPLKIMLHEGECQTHCFLDTVILKGLNFILFIFSNCLLMISG